MRNINCKSKNAFLPILVMTLNLRISNVFIIPSNPLTRIILQFGWQNTRPMSTDSVQMYILFSSECCSICLLPCGTDSSRTCNTAFVPMKRSLILYSRSEIFGRICNQDQVKGTFFPKMELCVASLFSIH